MILPIYRIPIYILCFLFACPVSSSTASVFSVNSTEREQIARLQHLEKDIHRTTLTLLSLLRSIQDDDLTVGYGGSVSKAKTIKEGSGVHETMEVSSRILYTPAMHEEFEVLEIRDQMIRIRLQDGREGWIGENNVQIISNEIPSGKSVKTAMPVVQQRETMQMVERLFQTIMEKKEKAVTLYEQLVKETDASGPANDTARGLLDRIRKYTDYAAKFYHEFNTAYLSSKASRSTFWENLRTETELLFGKQTYQTKYLFLPDDKQSDQNVQLSLSGNYQIDSTSDLDVSFSHKKDIIQTPFKTADVNIKYRKRLNSNWNVNGGLQLNSYRDEANPINDFNRFNLVGNGSYTPSAASRLDFHYAFLLNTFTELDSNSFNHHRLNASFEHNLNPFDQLLLRFQSQFSSSEQSHHNFTYIQPHLTFHRSTEKIKFETTALYELFAYSDLSRHTFHHTAFNVTRQIRHPRTLGGWELGIRNKYFPENRSAGFWRLRGKWLHNTSRGMSGTLTVYTQFHPKLADNDYTDFRLDLNSYSSGPPLMLSAYFRAWHLPGDTDEGSGIVKSHVLDLYGKVRFKLWRIRLGPTIGAHITISGADSIDGLKREGNVLRLGCTADVDHRWPGGMQISFQGTYEHGFVYYHEITKNQFEEIIKGDLQERHPTTLQLLCRFAVPVLNLFDVTARLKFYIINSDLDERFTFKPIKHNKHFSFMVGIRHTYQ